MRNKILKSIIFISIVILSLCVFMYLMFKQNVIITIEHFSFWSSILMTLAAILVTILLVFNFSYTFKIIEVSNDVQEKIKKYDDIFGQVEQLEEKYTTLSSPQYINELVFNREQVMNYLKDLKSKNTDERKQAALFFKNYEKDTYYYAILSALLREENEEIKMILNETVVKHRTKNT